MYSHHPELTLFSRKDDKVELQFSSKIPTSMSQIKAKGNFWYQKTIY